MHLVVFILPTALPSCSKFLLLHSKIQVIAFADGKIENFESKDHLDYEEKI